MTLPNFLVIGAQKAGTTSLYHYLRAHPAVFMSTIKETNYFDGHIAWQRGQAWYESLFDGADSARAVGEASTSYTMYPDIPGVPERIARLLPDVRLVYVVRDPIERMRSSYLHALARGIAHRPITEGLLADPRYLHMSQYGLQVEQYLRWFDRSRLLVMTAEGLRHDRARTLSTLFAFLGVDADLPDNVDQEFHTTADKYVPRPFARNLPLDRMPDRLRPLLYRRLAPGEADIDDDLRARLVDLLRPDVDHLRELVGHEFDGWQLA